ncbi:hypothetical protein [Paenibacillus elgii]|uniref:hypothetical protein n=1 Tax=Paenibacillus elgii TaxID=189691 RepID=UPI00203ED069|nr:hypothetical protein [Paenibacillus elgii]MCM3270608.1 hypothetical protein [Paenibacillus elgii]
MLVLTACSGQQQIDKTTKQTTANVSSHQEVQTTPTVPFTLKEIVRQVGNESYTDTSTTNSAIGASNIVERNGVFYVMRLEGQGKTSYYISAIKDNKWIFKDKLLDKEEGTGSKRINVIPGGIFYFDKNELKIKQMEEDGSVKEYSLGKPDLGQPWGYGYGSVMTSEGYAFVVRDGKIFTLYLLKDITNPKTIPNLDKINASEFKYVNFSNNTIIAMKNDKFSLIDLKTGEPQYDNAGQPIQYPFLKGDIIGYNVKGQWIYVEHTDNKLKLSYLDEKFRPSNPTTLEDVLVEDFGKKYIVAKNDIVLYNVYEYKGRPSVYTVNIKME